MTHGVAAMRLYLDPIKCEGGGKAWHGVAGAGRYSVTSLSADPYGQAENMGHKMVKHRGIYKSGRFLAYNAAVPDSVWTKAGGQMGLQGRNPPRVAEGKAGRRQR